MSDVTRILYETAGNSEAERQAARRTIASASTRLGWNRQQLTDILEALGLDR